MGFGFFIGFSPINSTLPGMIKEVIRRMSENLSTPKANIAEDYNWCDCLVECAVCGAPCCPMHCINISPGEKPIARYWCSVSCFVNDKISEIAKALTEE